MKDITTRCGSKFDLLTGYELSFNKDNFGIR